MAVTVVDYTAQLVRRVKKSCRMSFNSADVPVVIGVVTEPKNHQFDNSECGVYSIDFITKLLEGHKFEDLYSQQIPDDVMERKRDFYFIRV